MKLIACVREMMCGKPEPKPRLKPVAHHPIHPDEEFKFLTTHWQHYNQLSWSRLQLILVLQISTLAAAELLFEHGKHPGHATALIALGTFVSILLAALIMRDWQVRDYCAELLDEWNDPRGIFMPS